MPSRAFASYTPSLAWVAFTLDSIIPGIHRVHEHHLGVRRAVACWIDDLESQERFSSLGSFGHRAEGEREAGDLSGFGHGLARLRLHSRHTFHTLHALHALHSLFLTLPPRRRRDAALSHAFH